MNTLIALGYVCWLIGFSMLGGLVGWRLAWKGARRRQDEDTTLIRSLVRQRDDLMRQRDELRWFYDGRALPKLRDEQRPN